MIFALLTTTKLVTVKDLDAMAKALEINAQHLAKAYVIEPAPAIVVMDREDRVPDECFPVVMVDEGEESQTLAQHWFDRKLMRPAARVFVQNTTALNSGRYSVCEATSHEILEAVVNPELAVWFPHPQAKRKGVEIAYECCDPTQDHYIVTVDGTNWLVSNFVTPHWWRSELVNRPQDVALLERYEGYGLDWCMRLKTPGEISLEGYAVMRERTPNGTFRKWSEDQTGPLSSYAKKLDRKQHPASRTKRLVTPYT